MRRRVALGLFVVALFVTPLLLEFAGIIGPQEDRILVDGRIGDWSDVRSYSDVKGDVTGAGGLDVVEWGVLREDGYIAARARMDAPFEGLARSGRDGDVGLYLMVDADADPTTGYVVDAIGADLMVQVLQSFEGAVRASLHQWDARYRVPTGLTRTADDWNAWAPAPGGVEVAVEGRDVELKAAPEQAVAEGSTYVLVTRDAFGRGDTSDVSVDGRAPTLLVLQSPAGPDALPTGETDVLALTARAYGGDVRSEEHTV